MSTKFALAKLDVKMDDEAIFSFYFDGNGKITLANGSFENPRPNAFSLVQVQDCPYATPTCKSVCYVHNLEKAEEKIHAAYRHNSIVVRQVLEKSDYFSRTVFAFSNWIQRNCPKGFRWHVSGDIFSPRHAIFVYQVSELIPTVPCWIYTRSFIFLRLIFGNSGPKNLVINLSADKDNYKEAFALHRDFGWRICYLTVEGEVPSNLPDGSVIFPSYELRGRDLLDPKKAPWWQSLTTRQRQIVCPPDFFGQSEHLRCGPCKKCLV